MVDRTISSDVTIGDGTTDGGVIAGTDIMCFGAVVANVAEDRYIPQAGVTITAVDKILPQGGINLRNSDIVGNLDFTRCVLDCKDWEFGSMSNNMIMTDCTMLSARDNLASTITWGNWRDSSSKFTWNNVNLWFAPITGDNSTASLSVFMGNIDADSELNGISFWNGQTGDLIKGASPQIGNLLIFDRPLFGPIGFGANGFGGWSPIPKIVFRASATPIGTASNCILGSPDLRGLEGESGTWRIANDRSMDTYLINPIIGVPSSSFTVNNPFQEAGGSFTIMIGQRPSTTSNDIKFVTAVDRTTKPFLTFPEVLATNASSPTIPTTVASGIITHVGGSGGASFGLGWTEQTFTLAGYTNNTVAQADWDVLSNGTPVTTPSDKSYRTYSFQQSDWGTTRTFVPPVASTTGTPITDAELDVFVANGFNLFNGRSFIGNVDVNENEDPYIAQTTSITPALAINNLTAAGTIDQAEEIIARLKANEYEDVTLTHVDLPYTFTGSNINIADSLNVFLDGTGTFSRTSANLVLPIAASGIKQGTLQLLSSMSLGGSRSLFIRNGALSTEANSVFALTAPTISIANDLLSGSFSSTGNTTLTSGSGNLVTNGEVIITFDGTNPTADNQASTVIRGWNAGYIGTGAESNITGIGFNNTQAQPGTNARFDDIVFVRNNSDSDTLEQKIDAWISVFNALPNFNVTLEKVSASSIRVIQSPAVTVTGTVAPGGLSGGAVVNAFNASAVTQNTGSAGAAISISGGTYTAGATLTATATINDGTFGSATLVTGSDTTINGGTFSTGVITTTGSSDINGGTITATGDVALGGSTIDNVNFPTIGGNFTAATSTIGSGTFGITGNATLTSATISGGTFTVGGTTDIASANISSGTFNLNSLNSFNIANTGGTFTINGSNPVDIFNTTASLTVDKMSGNWDFSNVSGTQVITLFGDWSDMVFTAQPGVGNTVQIIAGNTSTMLPTFNTVTFPRILPPPVSISVVPETPNTIVYIFDNTGAQVGVGTAGQTVAINSITVPTLVAGASFVAIGLTNQPSTGVNKRPARLAFTVADEGIYSPISADESYQFSIAGYPTLIDPTDISYAQSGTGTNSVYTISLNNEALLNDFNDSEINKVVIEARNTAAYAKHVYERNSTTDIISAQGGTLGQVLRPNIDIITTTGDDISWGYILPDGTDFSNNAQGDQVVIAPEPVAITGSSITAAVVTALKQGTLTKIGQI